MVFSERGRMSKDATETLHNGLYGADCTVCSSNLFNLYPPAKVSCISTTKRFAMIIGRSSDLEAFQKAFPLFSTNLRFPVLSHQCIKDVRSSIPLRGSYRILTGFPLEMLKLNSSKPIMGTV